MPDAAPLTRAELRRRATTGIAPQPTAVVETPPAEAVSPVVADAPEIIGSIAAPAVAEPAMTRRRARDRARSGVDTAATAPSVAPLEQDSPPVAELPVADLTAEALAFPTAVPVASPIETAQMAVDAEARRAGIDAPAAPVEPITATITISDAASVDAASEDAASTATDGHDAFAAAAELFSFTGETPVQSAPIAAAAHEAAGPGVVDAGSGTDAFGRRRRLPVKRIAAASFSAGVIGMVGLLAFGMTTPVAAVAAANGTGATTSLLAGDVAPSSDDDEQDIQAYVASSDIAASEVVRSDDYELGSIAQVASDYSISRVSDLFTNDPTADIQWPFAVGVPISYGFGMRSGSMHEGVDFTPGAGAQVQAIAAGTVRIATEAGGAYGVTVVIDHVIDGELVSTRYAHMQYGSLQVTAGQTVEPGQIVGLVGNTGRSYGAHLHFEVLEGGTTAIDPLVWMYAHTES